MLPLPPITSLRNPWIRELKLLQQPKGRRQAGEFLIEGTHLLEEAIATGWPLTAVLWTEAWAEKHPALLARLDPAWRLQEVTAEVLRAIATTRTPDGVVAIGQRQDVKSQPWEAQNQGEQIPPHLAVAVATLQDPGNLGTLIRACVAAGGDRLWLSADSVDVDHPKVLRASAGQWFRQPPQVVTSLPDQVEVCRRQGLQVLAATASPGAVTYWDVDWRLPTLVLLGNEGAGLPEDLVAIADIPVQIPMTTGVESLNVSITGALLLYEAKRQRQQPAS